MYNIKTRLAVYRGLTGTCVLELPNFAVCITELASKWNVAAVENLLAEKLQTRFNTCGENLEREFFSQSKESKTIWGVTDSYLLPSFPHDSPRSGGIEFLRANSPSTLKSKNVFFHENNYY